MKKSINSVVLMWLLMLLGVVAFRGAEATAPRIGADLFGEKKKVEIIGYQFSSFDKSSKNDERLILDVVREAFAATGKSPVVDILPAKNLAKYNLTTNEVAVMIGRPDDLSATEKDKYHLVVFLFSSHNKEEPVVMIFNKKNAAVLYQAFDKGLQQIIQSGGYRQTLEKYRGKEGVPADFAQRLKQHNPAWK